MGNKLTSKEEIHSIKSVTLREFIKNKLNIYLKDNHIKCITVKLKDDAIYEGVRNKINYYDLLLQNGYFDDTAKKYKLANALYNTYFSLYGYKSYTYDELVNHSEWSIHYNNIDKLIHYTHQQTIVIINNILYNNINLDDNTITVRNNENDKLDYNNIDKLTESIRARLKLYKKYNSKYYSEDDIHNYNVRQYKMLCETQRLTYPIIYNLQEQITELNNKIKKLEQIIQPINQTNPAQISPVTIDPAQINQTDPDQTTSVNYQTANDS